MPNSTNTNVMNHDAVITLHDMLRDAHDPSRVVFFSTSKRVIIHHDVGHDVQCSRPASCNPWDLPPLHRSVHLRIPSKHQMLEIVKKWSKNGLPVQGVPATVQRCVCWHA